MILSEDQIRHAIDASFERKARVQSILIRDWQLTVVIACDHLYGPVKLSELVGLAERLFVPIEQVTIWDLAPNVLEIFVDCDHPTPIERPTALPRKPTIK